MVVSRNRFWRNKIIGLMIWPCRKYWYYPFANLTNGSFEKRDYREGVEIGETKFSQKSLYFIYQIARGGAYACFTRAVEGLFVNLEV